MTPITPPIADKSATVGERLKFTAEMFERDDTTTCNGLVVWVEVANIANDLFDSWLSKQEVVYGYGGGWIAIDDPALGSREKGRLCCIEEIKNEIGRAS